MVSGFDAGIRLAEDVPRDMVSVPLQMPLRSAIVRRARAVSRKAASPQARRAHVVPLHLRSPVERCAVPLGIRAQRQKGQREVKGALTLDAPTLMLEAALGGVGLAYLADWSVSSHIESGHLVRVARRLDADVERSCASITPASISCPQASGPSSASSARSGELSRAPAPPSRRFGGRSVSWLASFSAIRC